MFQKGGRQRRSPVAPRQADGVRNKNPARGPFAKGGKLGRGRNPSKNAKRRVRPGNTWARHRFLTERPAQTAHKAYALQAWAKTVGPSPSICSLNRMPGLVLATIDASVAARLRIR